MLRITAKNCLRDVPSASDYVWKWCWSLEGQLRRIWLFVRPAKFVVIVLQSLIKIRSQGKQESRVGFSQGSSWVPAGQRQSAMRAWSRLDVLIVGDSPELFNGTVQWGYSACRELCVKVGVVLFAWKWCQRAPDSKVMLHLTKVCTTGLTVQADGFLRKPTLIPHWKRPETLSPSPPSCGVSMSIPCYEILRVAK